MTINWYDIIKQQWQMGWYSDPSQLDVYVQAGWITGKQKNEIISYKKPTDDYPQEPEYNPDNNEETSESTEDSTTEPPTDSTDAGEEVDVK